MFTRRRLLLVGVVVLAGTYLVAGGLGLPALEPTDGNTPSEGKMVQPVENGSYLWPYTSRGKTTKQRTLATNIVIVGDDNRVKRLLTQQSKLKWEITRPTNETTGNETVLNESDVVDAPTPIAPNGTNTTAENDTDARPVTLKGGGFGWEDTHGATRYSYIDARSVGGGSGWVDEAYQIHAGEYFGSRYHIRAYTTPAANYTAIQVHKEYFDWFRLRHTVTGIQHSRNVLESKFLEKPYVQEVSREYHSINRGWNDGWLSEIHLVPGVAVLFVMSLLTRQTHRSMQRELKRFLGWTRDHVRGFVLVGTLVALVLGVRSGGIVFEKTFPAVDPRLVFPVFYAVLAVGLPLAAFVLTQPFGATERFRRLQRIAKHLGSRIDPLPAFGFAFVGLTMAFVLDFGGIGVSKIPVQLVLHRVGLACALGLIAAGSARIDEEGAGLLALGVLGWIVGLAMPLVGYI